LVRVAARSIPDGAVSAEGIAEPDFITALLEDALREIGRSARRCVAAVGFPQAFLRVGSFPRMTALERSRTARYEVLSGLSYPIEEAVVRTRRLSGEPDKCAIGVVRADILRGRVSCLRRAGLRVAKIDDEGCALRRAFPGYDAVLDVGHLRTTLYLLHSCETFQARLGGGHITSAIEQDLSIDRHAAEQRKRILGTAGAGERLRNELVARITAMVQAARTVCSIARVAVVGNGSRLPGLHRDIGVAAGLSVELAVSHVLHGSNYAPDVTRAGAPDWTLAAALPV
jgi:Tfp pilus assembly PilM family ATPase